MTMIHHNATTHGSGDRPRNTLAGYFARYRIGLYLLAGAGIAAGISLSGGSPTVAKLLPFMVFLPCIVMMLMCMKHGSQSPDGPAAEPAKMLPPQPGKLLDPQ
jgi:hypothetical protein